jgi:hypothetical protein
MAYLYSLDSKWQAGGMGYRQKVQAGRMGQASRPNKRNKSQTVRAPNAWLDLLYVRAFACRQELYAAGKPFERYISAS